MSDYFPAITDAPRRVFLTTYKDLVDHLQDYAGADASQETARIARRAVQAAYLRMTNSHKWSYYYKRGFINTSAFISGAAQVPPATVTYSSATNQVTVTGGAPFNWPSWTQYGSLLIANTHAPLQGGNTGTAQLVYDIASVVSPTVVQLTGQSNTGVDITNASDFTLYRDTYPLPADFFAADEMINLNNLILLNYEHPREWLSRQRIVHTPAIPRLYTITGDPHYYGTMAVRFFPPPDIVYNINFLYQRRPRPDVTWDYHTGTVSTNGTTTITGVGTTWTSAMVGSVFRYGNSQTPPLVPPTGIAGSLPFQGERTITAVASATSLTVDATTPETLSGVPYQISDPVDYEDGAMAQYFLRECEFQFRVVRRIKHLPEEVEAHKTAMFEAWEADARNFAVRSAGQRGEGRIRLAYMPRGPDVS